MEQKVVYHMKPLFELNNEFNNSSSMYKLKNLMNGCMTSSNNLFQSNNSNLVQEEELILARQEKLLFSLKELKEKVSTFHGQVTKLKIDSKNLESVNSHNQVEDADVQNFVINADINNPPFALLWLPKLWDLHVKINFHIHSSVLSLPESLSMLFDRLNLRRTSSIPVPINTATFIWKNVGQDHELNLSPMKYTKIRGEVNVLRFFDYILNPDEDIIDRTRKDEVLDLAHRLNYCNSNQDQKSVLNQLRKYLSKGPWFLGKLSPSIADAAVWSALHKIENLNIPRELQDFKALSSKELTGQSVLQF